MKKQKSNQEEKYTNQGWGRTLTELSNHAPGRYESKTSYDKKYPLVKKAKIKPHELPLILDFLEKQGLIEYNKSEGGLITLTSKGLDVALQNQRAGDTHKIRQSALFLSLVIAITALLSLLSGIENLSERYALSGIFIIAIVIGGCFIIKSK